MTKGKKTMKTENGKRFKLFRGITPELTMVQASMRKQGKVVSLHLRYDGKLPSCPKKMDRLVRKILKGLETVESRGFGNKSYRGFKDPPSAHYNTSEREWTFKVYTRKYTSLTRSVRLTDTPVTRIHESKREQVHAKKKAKVDKTKSDRAAALAKAQSLLTKKELRLLRLPTGR